MTTACDANEYSITVKKVTLDGETEFEATVLEFPDVVVYEESYTAAYSVALDLIAGLIEDAIGQGKTVPAPAGPKDFEEYSGRVTLRMSKSLHATVSRQAEENGVSLNSWIVEAIAAKSAPPVIVRGFSKAEATYPALFSGYATLGTIHQKTSSLRGLETISIDAGNTAREFYLATTLGQDIEVVKQ